MNPFIPEFEGELELARIPDDFVARMRKRVEVGLLWPGIKSRANYSVRSAGRDEINFGADDLLTAYNVGLNDVSVRRQGSNAVHYHVNYWRWTWTAVAHGAILGTIIVVCAFFIPDMRRQIDTTPNGLYLFAGLLLFFCLLWPWILTALHRSFAEKALRRILSEVMS
ncbi:MAG TPA: hypothetical protein VJQ53_02930 [Candidatus Eisenbacteria bacterium]|nr:hypothetical protein [Candidatus Eisenbacteria bacterium]